MAKLLWRLACVLSLILALEIGLRGQENDLSYYLPNVDYVDDITTPKEYFGFDVGDWHLSHDQLLAYCKLLAFQSERIEIELTGKTHEDRQLCILHISSGENLSQKDEIRKEHLKLTDVSVSENLNVDLLPLVLYQGYSIHGNESSGANAVPLVLYYLAAAQGGYIEDLLTNVYILLDPCYNPDGLQRFSNWVNGHKSQHLVSDPQSREFNEVWPGGRTNHYWFDLNRDWLLLSQPESRSRMKTFHAWKPNILTDHHEMGTNSTFFFQPGVPSRTNPNTPWENQDLTEQIGTFHAHALDSIGSQYFSKKRYDDFYYGKGSTYPDIHGSIGILFEQASARGHIQESENGLLTFPFTIRNQVVTSLSTQRAALKMRTEILDYQRRFYLDKMKESEKSKIGGYRYSDMDKSKLASFTSLLLQHDIQVFKSKSNSNEYYVPSLQKQTGLVNTIFETVTSFKDSIFYDVSTWTIPLAYDLNFSHVDKKSWKSLDMVQIKAFDDSTASLDPFSPNTYAWIFDWTQSDAPVILEKILNAGLEVKVATEAFKVKINEEERSFGPGSIIVPYAQNAQIDLLDFKQIMNNLSPKFTTIYSLKSGYGSGDVHLGSPSFKKINQRKFCMLIGEGIRAYDAGEVWHYMDKEVRTAISQIDVMDFNAMDLNRYTTMILVDGTYGELDESGKAKLKKWIFNGGEVIAMRRSVEFLDKLGVVQLTNADNKKESLHVVRQYQMRQNQQGAKVLGGAIFKAEIDLNHPLGFGYADNEIPMFRKGVRFYEKQGGDWSYPLNYIESPLMSGYVPRGAVESAGNTPASSVHKHGKGRIICFSDNLLFRGYWKGTFKLFSNALYFNQIIDDNTRMNK